MAPASGRTAEGVANDERILDAAVGMLRSVNPDTIGLRDVAVAVGLSYGALYGRFDSADDLLAEVWARRLGEVVRTQVDLAASIGRGADPPDAATDVEPLLPAAVVLCIMSARVEGLADVVPRDVGAWLDAAGVTIGADAGPADVAALGVLSFLLGTAAITPVEGRGAGRLHQLVAWWRAGSGPTWSGPRPVSAPPQRFDRFRFADPDLERLIAGAASVVSRTGIELTTLKRVARSASCAPSALYGFYASRDDLMVDVVRRCMSVSRGPEDALQEHRSPIDGPAAIVAGWMDRSSAVTRRVMLEIVLAAHYDPRLADLIREAHAEMYEVTLESLRQVGMWRDRTVALIGMNQDLIMGASVLAGLVDGLESVDWRPFASAVTIGSLPPRARSDAEG